MGIEDWLEGSDSEYHQFLQGIYFREKLTKEILSVFGLFPFINSPIIIELFKRNDLQ